MVSLARPPAVAPPHVGRDSRLQRVCIRHLGYGVDPNNILLNLPAVDETSNSSRGLHHRTALTAGAILANNAFDLVYLAYDQAGRDRVAIDLDGILAPGDYWLHLRREEPLVSSNVLDAPTVPPNPPKNPPAGSREEWFISNGMAQYADEPGHGIEDAANLATMRSDIRSLFDSHRFVIVPKPSTTSTTSSSTSFALAVHVLQEGSDGIVPLHHNVSIQPSSAATLSRHFLFARFALSIFTLAKSFVDSFALRYLSVTKLEESATKLAWMSGQQLARYRDQRGKSRIGTKKRSLMQISCDHPADAEAVDEYDVSWKRRSRSLDRTHTFDPDEEELDGCTRWYHRFTAAVGSPEEGLERRISWHDVRAGSDSWGENWTEVHRGRSRIPKYDDINDLSLPDLDDVPTLSRSFTTGWK
ncbi:hypothetical protein VP1G_10386 [Cytospora mali]|nr:hypothetical protein VP1G_10386 [Valsa mali var. pyri (nom. inval.)]